MLGWLADGGKRGPLQKNIIDYAIKDLLATKKFTMHYNNGLLGILKKHLY